MDKADPLKKIMRRLRNYFILQTGVVATASVMAFGFVEVWANLMLYKSHDYGAEYMLGMMGPIALAMLVISALNLKAARRHIELILAGEAPRVSRVPRKWLPLEACALGFVAALFFLVVEIVGRPSMGSTWSYPPAALAGMAAAMGVIMTAIGLVVMRESKLRILRVLMDTVRSSSDAANPKWLEAMRLFDGSQIASRLKRWLAAVSAGIVIISVMTFGLVDFVSNIMMDENLHYNPVKMVGMIFPMGLVLGLVSYGILRVASRYTSQLLRGIESVADGRFGAKLNEAHAGPFREVFANFNRMCEELQGVQTLRDDFINNFSHEFKTPITSINGFAKVLLEERVSDEERRQYLKIIAEESERLEEMASGALMMSKLDSQQYIVDPESFSLDEQMRQCAIILSQQWTKKRLDLYAELESASFCGNEALMRQVWLNLLSNAIKFTPEGGRIALGLKLERNWLVATIADTGKGMSEEELGRAFEKYYQADPSHASRGLGLGLAIVKKIVELSGGTVEARSELGKGSAFIVRLPAKLISQES